MNLLTDHVVLVTGGGSGLGLGVLRRCLELGAEAAVLEVSPEKVAALREELGDRVLVLSGDVRSTEDLTAARDAIVERFGRLDALIGCQGIFDGQVPLMDTPLEKVAPLFDELFHVNVLGYVLSVRILGDLLTASRGAVVLTSSTAAYAADGGGLFYSATKGAVRSVVNQLAFELAPHVRVNGIAPSGIAHSQLRGPEALGLSGSKQSDIPAEDFAAHFRALSLMTSVPTPEDYGWLYAFLASRQNLLVSGQTLVMDQGVLNRAVISSGNQAGGIPLD